MEFPSAARTNHNRRRVVTVGSDSRTPRGVILVVDDEPTMRTLLRQFLPDWRVEEAGDGQAGLAKAREVRPDLIIADWVMPRLSGPEMVKRLRADPQLSHVPVVMLTALADVEHRAKSYHSGADHFLPKDFEPEELLAIIERAVQRTQPLSFAAPLMQALHDQVETKDMAEIGEAVSLLGEFQQRGVEMVLHAGDYCAPFALRPFQDYAAPMVGVYGRTDGDREGLKSIAAQALACELFEDGGIGASACLTDAD